MGHQQHTQAMPECVCPILSVPISEGSKGLIFDLFLAPNPFLDHVLGWHSNFLDVGSTSTIMHHSVGNKNDFFFFQYFQLN